MGYSAGFGKMAPEHSIFTTSLPQMLTCWCLGAVNFFFGLLAVRRIDTWGRRKLMLTTLPVMSVFLAAAALTFVHDYWRSHIPVLVIFIYGMLLRVPPPVSVIDQNRSCTIVFSAVYSPSLGPIPFTLASESFPLAQREAVSPFQNPPQPQNASYTGSSLRILGKLPSKNSKFAH